MCIGHWGFNCELLNYMEYNCEYRPLEMKFMICSRELNRVMIYVLNYMRVIVVD